jgi:XrtN system VIT domain protein
MNNLKLFIKLKYIGLSAIGLTGIILIIASKINSKPDDIFEGNSLFFINYFVSLAYFISIIATNRPFFKFQKVDHRLYIISLILFSISCFTLNYSFTLFATFSDWVVVYLVLFYSAFLSICFIEKIKGLFRTLIMFMLGAGLILLFYFIIYLAPIYIYGLIGLILLGLTIHLFIPLFVALSVIRNFIRFRKSLIDKIAFTTGILLPLVIVVVFLFKWQNFSKEIHQANAASINRPDNKLPEWILLCQEMPTDAFSEKIIKGDLVFDTFKDLWGGWGNTTFDEIKRHDPLVNIGLALMDDINLDNDTRIKILKSHFDARHLTQRRLWSDRNLGTTEVLTQCKIFADYRLAYTEKTITIKNFNTWLNDQKEAAFTFYLPEGSVATSLSLWVDGKEVPSRLTTKEKADSAYVNIVGVQRRDPAIMHWQEGNTITVTVFPCTPKENRKFKIGITTPLKVEDNKLVYSNIYFDGPINNKIFETSLITIESEHDIKHLNKPSKFEDQLDNSLIYSGKYMPYWELSFDKMPISSKSFGFNNKSYSITELKKEIKPIDLKTIYLDINKSWTKAEFELILNESHNIQIFAHRDRFIKISDENKEQVFKLLSKRNFSLFPFSQIHDKNTSLVITKCPEISPNLSDLAGSEFLDELGTDLAKDQSRINLFLIGNSINSYLKSLKELQVFNFNKGDISNLRTIFSTKSIQIENSDLYTVDLDINQVSIHQSMDTNNEHAPDHLLRLFAYNQLMKELGHNYFNKNNTFIDSLTKIANEAYIVSPVSSLIVLESKKDYDRFEIGENENSLKNATLKSSGAVPEPSTWILIGLFLLCIFIIYLRKKKLQISQ